jgi:hypothetical protein
MRSAVRVSKDKYLIRQHCIENSGILDKIVLNYEFNYYQFKSNSISQPVNNFLAHAHCHLGGIVRMHSQCTEIGPGSTPSYEQFSKQKFKKKQKKQDCFRSGKVWMMTKKVRFTLIAVIKHIVSEHFLYFCTLWESNQ